MPLELIEMIVSFYDEELVHFLAPEYEKDSYRISGWSHTITRIQDIVPSY